MTTVDRRIGALIVSLDRVCLACLAAYSQASWFRLHSLQRMRRAVADYERRVRVELGEDADTYFANSRSGAGRRPLCTITDRRLHWGVTTMADIR